MEDNQPTLPGATGGSQSARLKPTSPPLNSGELDGSQGDSEVTGVVSILNHQWVADHRQGSYRCGSAHRRRNGRGQLGAGPK